MGRTIHVAVMADQSFVREGAVQKSILDTYCTSTYYFENWYTHSDGIKLHEWKI
jgi:hypothetical protein